LQTIPHKEKAPKSGAFLFCTEDFGKRYIEWLKVFKVAEKFSVL
jgi:hypothetical protein